MSASILATGLAMMDIYPAEGKMYPGGNEHNIACYAAALGARAGFIGTLAGDGPGRLLRQGLQSHGVDIRFCRAGSGYTNFALVELRDGDRVFADYTRHAVADGHPITFTRGELAYAQGFDAVCLGYACRLPLASIRQLHTAGCTLAYDFSEAADADKMRTLCPLLDFAVFSCGGKSTAQVRATLAAAVHWGAKIAVATMGAQGSMAYDGCQYAAQKALPADVVDTMGAGDSFIAGFLCRYFAGSQPPALGQALRAGAENARRIIQRQGALGVGYPITPAAIRSWAEKEANSRQAAAAGGRRKGEKT